MQQAISHCSQLAYTRISAAHKSGSDWGNSAEATNSDASSDSAVTAQAPSTASTKRFEKGMSDGSLVKGISEHAAAQSQTAADQHPAAENHNVVSVEDDDFGGYAPRHAFDEDQSQTAADQPPAENHVDGWKDKALQTLAKGLEDGKLLEVIRERLKEDAEQTLAKGLEDGKLLEVIRERLKEDADQPPVAKNHESVEDDDDFGGYAPRHTSFDQDQPQTAADQPPAAEKNVSVEDDDFGGYAPRHEFLDEDQYQLKGQAVEEYYFGYAPKHVILEESPIQVHEPEVAAKENSAVALSQLQVPNLDMNKLERSVSSTTPVAASSASAAAPSATVQKQPPAAAKASAAAPSAAASPAIETPLLAVSDEGSASTTAREFYESCVTRACYDLAVQVQEVHRSEAKEPQEEPAQAPTANTPSSEDPMQELYRTFSRPPIHPHSSQKPAQAPTASSEDPSWYMEEKRPSEIKAMPATQGAEYIEKLQQEISAKDDVINDLLDKVKQLEADLGSSKSSTARLEDS